MNKCGGISKRWKTNCIKLLEKEEQEKPCPRSEQEKTKDIKASTAIF